MKLSKDSPRINKILEIGFGEGYNMNLLSESKQNQVIGIELSKDTIRETKARFPHLDVRQMNAEKLYFKDQEFNEIYAFEVLEHVDHLKKVVLEVERVLAPQGKITLSIPHDRSQYLLLRIRPSFFKEIHHVRVFKDNQLETIMKDQGFRLVSKKRIGFLSHAIIICQFLTTNKSNSQLSIGNWRNHLISRFVYLSVGFFEPFILKTPGKYIPIWIITLPIGYTLNFFGNMILPRSIYYEFIKEN